MDIINPLLKGIFSLSYNHILLSNYISKQINNMVCQINLTTTSFIIINLNKNINIIFITIKILNITAPVAVAATASASRAAERKSADPLTDAVLSGLAEGAAQAAEQMLREMEPQELIDKAIIPVLDEVGRRYEAGTLFLPQLMRSADAAKAACEVVRQVLASKGGVPDGEPIVIATVKGDIHDIGKNIVRAVLENYGYRIIDLGRDVPPETVVEAVRESGARLCGLSALMTTTVPAMEETIRQLRVSCPDCRVMVGVPCSLPTGRKRPEQTIMSRMRRPAFRRPGSAWENNMRQNAGALICQDSGIFYRSRSASRASMVPAARHRPLTSPHSRTRSSS